jgi:CRP-like cAMP-binding protein/membrane protein YdbS with pleckstrin-like domain
MALTREQMARLPALLTAAPPWARTQAFWTDLAVSATAEPLAANQVLFTPGSPVGYLYLVVDGLVQHTYGLLGQVWFRQELKSGSFFGQQALFSDQHLSRALAPVESLVYRLSAADVRGLLEKYPGLREFLLHETMASRLRSIPLFESLADDDIRWLASLITESEVPAGTPLPLSGEPGVHVIDWGQVAVRVPSEVGYPEKRLTAGNFFLTQGLRIGAPCAVLSAMANRKSRLLYLSNDDFYRLVRAFPEISIHLQQPIAIATEHLAGIPLLHDDPLVGRGHLEHLAGYCAWAFVPGGQNISTQGSLGYSYVIIRRGAALVSAVDEQGRLRPRNTLRAGASFGATSLLEGSPRDVTVRAVQGESEGDRLGLNGAELIMLDRRDLQQAFADAPDLWTRGVRVFDRFARLQEGRPKYDWLEPEERVIWDGRGHWLWFVVPLLTTLLIEGIIFVAARASGLLSLVLAPGDWLAKILVVLLLALPIVWVVTNYYNDFYVVTNRRVSRRDRVFLIREVLTDAPISMVQDVTLGANLMGRLFDYGDLTVRTASKVGDVEFNHVPHADIVRSFILQERAGAVAAGHVHTKEMLRQGLLTGLGLGLAVPDPDRFRALGSLAGMPAKRSFWRKILPGSGDTTSTARSLPGWAQGLSPRWQHILFGPPRPPKQRASGEIVWHKSWVNLVQRAFWPFAFLALVVLLTPLLTDLLVGVLKLEPTTAWLIRLVIIVPLIGWLWWEVANYWNDIYVVTDEKLIDIERTPLALSLKQREGSLDRIQTVFVRQTGILENLLNYGNVVITTAAADEGFTFLSVGNPKQVQRDIFRKLDAFRRKQEEKATIERQRQIIEGLAVYHELRGDIKQ